MTVLITIFAAVTLSGAVAAMTLRNLVHCALALTVAFAGLSTLYLSLDAQFAGLAQLLVYVGAIAILIVFAILLTPGAPESNSRVKDADHFLRPGWLRSGPGSLRNPRLVSGAQPHGKLRCYHRSSSNQYAPNRRDPDASLHPADRGHRAHAHRGPDRRRYRCDEGESSAPVTPLTAYLLVSALLFSVGLAGALTRRSAILYSPASS